MRALTVVLVATKLSTVCAALVHEDDESQHLVYPSHSLLDKAPAQFLEGDSIAEGISEAAVAEERLHTKEFEDAMSVATKELNEFEKMEVQAKAMDRDRHDKQHHGQSFENILKDTTVADATHKEVKAAVGDVTAMPVAAIETEEAAAVMIEDAGLSKDGFRKVFDDPDSGGSIDDNEADALDAEAIANSQTDVLAEQARESKKNTDVSVSEDEMGVDAATKLLKNVFETGDINNDGLVSKQEFIRAMGGEENKKESIKVFKTFDIDNDGFVDGTDVMDKLSKKGLDAEIPQ